MDPSSMVRLKLTTMIYNMKNTYSWIFTAVLVVVGISIVVSGSAAAQSADIVVSTDGNEDYSSIQAAIDNAEQNDRIEVKPGTYSESVDINKNVELVASNGATIAPPSSAVSAVAIENGAEPRLENITITGENRIGLDARSTTADWTVTSLKISGFDFGITTLRSQSDWGVEDTIIKNVKTRGISADESEGNWTINSTIIRNVAGIGVDA
jgi:pectin methylesterase-like acyl-CoA thioesterase